MICFVATLFPSPTSLLPILGPSVIRAQLTALTPQTRLVEAFVHFEEKEHISRQITRHTFPRNIHSP